MDSKRGFGLSFVLRKSLLEGIDALAIAPYFGGYLGQRKHQKQVETWDLEQLFTEINQGGVLNGGPPGGAIAAALRTIENNLAVAKKRHLQLIAMRWGTAFSRT
ncbi:MAG: hypothetical protein GDA44_04480 [Prochloron sp. SP5CPC1]|nr:hypothetical protein [Candidatus Paraprochloron terpiosi SP5CPC1]